jgi:anti-sigma B factor antagonist
MVNIVGKGNSKGWQIIAASGRVDAHTAPEFEKGCHSMVSNGIRLAIDLGEVAYMSSAGLRVLLSTLKLCKSQGGKLVLVAPRPNVQEVLQVSGFTTVFTVVPTVDSLEQAG